MNRLVALLSGVGLGAGLLHALSPRRRGDDPERDDVVAARVRARLRRLPFHPHALHVQAHQGRVILSGLVLANEARDLLSAVASVRGVDAVEDHLEREAAAGAPPSDGDHGGWPPALRLAMAAAGAGLGLYGARQRSGVGAGLGVLGMGLLLRTFLPHQSLVRPHVFRYSWRFIERRSFSR